MEKRGKSVKQSIPFYPRTRYKQEREAKQTETPSLPYRQEDSLQSVLSTGVLLMHHNFLPKGNTFSPRKTVRMDSFSALLVTCAAGGLGKCLAVLAVSIQKCVFLSKRTILFLHGGLAKRRGDRREGNNPPVSFSGGRQTDLALKTCTTSCESLAPPTGFLGSSSLPRPVYFAYSCH